LDQEEYRATCSTAVERGQLYEMLPSSVCNSVGEHGDATVEERARLDLEIQILAIPAKEEIKPAFSKRYFPTYEIESA
jgi:hypothetical protein